MSRLLNQRCFLFLFIFACLISGFNAARAHDYAWELIDDNRVVLTGRMAMVSSTSNTEEVSPCSSLQLLRACLRALCLSGQASASSAMEICTELHITYTHNNVNLELDEPLTTLFPFLAHPFQHQTSRRYTFTAPTHRIRHRMTQCFLYCCCFSCLLASEYLGEAEFLEDTRDQLKEYANQAKGVKGQIMEASPIGPDRRNPNNFHARHTVSESAFQPSQAPELSSRRSLASDSNVIIMNLLLTDSVSMDWIHAIGPYEINLHVNLLIPELFSQPVPATFQMAATTDSDNGRQENRPTHRIQITAGPYQLVYLIRITNSATLLALRLRVGHYILNVQNQGFNPEVYNEQLNVPPEVTNCNCGGACNCRNSSRDDDTSDGGGFGGAGSLHHLSY